MKYVHPNIVKCGRDGGPLLFRAWNHHIFVTFGLMPSFGTLGQLFKIPPLSLGPISAHADGVLAPGSAHARPSARHLNQNERNFVGACVCKVTCKHLPQPFRRNIRSFRTLGQRLKIPPFSALSAGGFAKYDPV